MKSQRMALFAFCIFAAAVAKAENAELVWTLADGSVATEVVPLVASNDVFALTLPQAAIRDRRASRLVITPDFGRARTGEAGYWFSPYGPYGEWERENGRYYAKEERQNMPMYGWSTPRGAYLALVTKMPYYVHELVTATNGEYAVSCVLEEDLCREPYDDFRIEFRRFTAGTPYAELAKAYRRYQLERGAVQPLRERVKANPALKYAVEAPEIRIRQAWKPVPSPVPDQQPENEPPVKVAVTFERVKDIVRELKRQGVAEAELCLVGWNIGGHDGRWPQAFPAEPLLGGDEGLKEAIRFARENGYQIVPHGNFLDAYAIADCWDAEWTVKNEDGSIRPDRDGTVTWGGGRPYRICAQRAYEKFCTKDLPRMAAFGFVGLGYFDVASILRAPICHDPRHRCTYADSVRYWGMCAEISKKCFGGFASEGAMDHFAGSLDSVLYASWDTEASVKAEYAEGGLARRCVPIFQIVYNGIIVQNPFADTVNFTIQDRREMLKLIEYGGRPNFYFYSKFLSDGNDWMGARDLRCDTDEQLAASVAKIREGYDIYRRLNHLQYEFMENHEMLAEGVFRTTWSNGESVTVDYNAGTWTMGR